MGLSIDEQTAVPPQFVAVVGCAMFVTSVFFPNTYQLYAHIQYIHIKSLL